MKIKVEICLGTTCHLMGASELVDLERQLPAELVGMIEVIGSACLGACHNRQYGGAPYVRINEKQLISEANIQTITEYLLREIGENGEL
ncbi:MAG: (2Fe-2S) ferredoxin domain-containing protein [Planctomycetaceae bacterium]|jgi:NADH:ubiquinone oxidoreductase subunit E|nr:(2Fe-2S) ferredoxin domain-containing protein [Planctomycetaceae bacterium]